MLKVFIEELLRNTGTGVDGLNIRLYLQDGSVTIEVGDNDGPKVVCCSRQRNLEEMIISAFMMYMKNKICRFNDIISQQTCCTPSESTDDIIESIRNELDKN